MLFKCYCVIAIFAIFYHAPVLTAVDSPMGVSPKDLPQYQENTNGTFTCFDKSNVISFKEINDDYCDCLDGSDEPGTSACKLGHFYCTNKGHLSAFIPASYVNDGICEPECCDGSDEYDGKIRCPNTCEEKEAQQRTAEAEKLRTAQKGAKKKAILIKKGKEKLLEVSNHLKEVESELGYLKNVVSLKKYQLESAEREEKESEEKEKMYGKLTPRAMASQISRLQEMIHRLQSAVSSFRNSNQSKEDVDILLNQFDEDTSTESEDLIPIPTLDDGAIPDPTSFLERVKSSWKILWNVSPPKPLDIARERTNKAREEHDETLDKERKLTEKKKELDAILSLDTRKNHAFLTFYDQCYSIVVEEYTYILCPFKKAIQKEANGYEVNLGRWDGNWLDDSTWLLEGGQSCWSGPDRSTKVILECGVEPRLSKAAESSRCVYEMRFQNPASCGEVDPEPEIPGTYRGEDL